MVVEKKIIGYSVRLSSPLLFFCNFPAFLFKCKESRVGGRTSDNPKSPRLLPGSIAHFDCALLIVMCVWAVGIRLRYFYTFPSGIVILLQSSTGSFKVSIT